MSPGSGSWLAALCTSRVLAATWFVAYSSVLPLTQAAWSLSAKEAGMIQAAFHLGYLTSLFIVGFIADHFGAKRAYITTGVAACLSPWSGQGRLSLLYWPSRSPGSGRRGASAAHRPSRSRC